MKLHINEILNQVTEFESIKIYLSKIDILQEYADRIHEGDLSVDFHYSDELCKHIISTIDGLFIQVENDYGYKFWKLNLKQKYLDYTEPLHTKEELIQMIFDKTDPSKRLKGLVKLKSQLKKS